MTVRQGRTVNACIDRTANACIDRTANACIDRTALPALTARPCLH